MCNVKACSSLCNFSLSSHCIGVSVESENEGWVWSPHHHAALSKSLCMSFPDKAQIHTQENWPGFHHLNTRAMCVFGGVWLSNELCWKFQTLCRKRGIRKTMEDSKGILKSGSYWDQTPAVKLPAAVYCPSPRGAQDHSDGMQIIMKSLRFLNNMRPQRWLDFAKRHKWWPGALKCC